MARRSRDEWIKLVEESRSSDMTQAAFCEERGISVGGLQYWMRKLRKEEGYEASPSGDAGIRLLPLQIADPAPEFGVEVLLPDGIQLRFPPTAKPAYVASVLSALAS